MFCDGPLRHGLHWQQSRGNILHIPANTIVIPVVNNSGKVIADALQQGIFMFGEQVKFVITGNSPHLIQCSHCHQLGHPSCSPRCKLHPAAVKCYQYSRSHHSDHHDYKCKGMHCMLGPCNCKPKCLLCGTMSHVTF